MDKVADYPFRNLAVGATNISFVQLDTPKLSPDRVTKIEDVCNELIRQGVAMTPRWYPPNAPELEGVSVMSHSPGPTSPLSPSRYVVEVSPMTLKGRR